MIFRLALIIASLLLSAAGMAANLFNGTPSAIVEPVCIDNPDAAFIAESPPPEDRYSLIVRHMGEDALDARPSFDFSVFGGLPLTNLRVPEPLTLANAFCRARDEIADCAMLPGHSTALSVDPADYRIFEFSMITEILSADTELGLYNFR